MHERRATFSCGCVSVETWGTRTAVASDGDAMIEYVRRLYWIRCEPHFQIGLDGAPPDRSVTNVTVLALDLD